MRNSPVDLRIAATKVQPVSASLILVALVLPLALIAFRVSSISAGMQDRFIEPWLKTTVVEKPVAARTGRILTADGLVLAVDRTEFELEVHYRWIEEPANPTWLRGEARQRLTRSERNDSEKVAAAEQAVLSERATAWEHLARQIDGVGVQRTDIQQRVERIRKSVLAQREAKQASASPTVDADKGLLERIWQEISSPPQRYSNDPLILREELDYHKIGVASPEVVTQILDRPTLFRGMRIASTGRRDYPAGDLAGHVIGFRGNASESNEASDAVRMAAGIDVDTQVGRAGVELSYDRVLRGRNGVEEIERRRDGLQVGTKTVRQPLHGQDVSLTIDSRVQAAAEAALDELLAADSDVSGGAAIVMDVETGGLIAAAAGPRVSPSIYIGLDQDTWKSLLDDPRQPLFPRATRMAIPPGSVFKLVTAIAALESGWDPQREIFCQGYFRDPKSERCALYRQAGYGHDRLPIDSALGVSCNVFFFELASAIKADPISDWASRCGFGWETGIDLPGESAGNTPDATDLRYGGSVRQLAIGQGNLTATPLQVTRLTAAIANGGKLFRPSIAAMSTLEYDVLSVSDHSLQVLRAGMVAAVHGPMGTARSLADLHVKLAGKTGSAEVGGDKRSHAWFTGYFPADAPRYAVTVAIEHGGSGGTTAAPIAGRIAEVASAVAR